MDVGALMYPRRLLRIMTSVAGVVVFFESLNLLSQATTASFTGFGILSIGTVSIVLLHIATTSLFISILSLLSLMNNLEFVRKCHGWASKITLAVGVVLSVEGLGAISLRNSIVLGATTATMIVVGLQMYALGIMSVTAHTWDKWNLSLARAIPSIGVLLFLILMLPPSFLVN
jgi:hypothetical protein